MYIYIDYHMCVCVVKVFGCGWRENLSGIENMTSKSEIAEFRVLCTSLMHTHVNIYIEGCCWCCVLKPLNEYIVDCGISKFTHTHNNDTERQTPNRDSFESTGNFDRTERF